MPTFAQRSRVTSAELQEQLRAVLPARASSVEAASQALATFLFQAFEPSVALARVYAIVPVRALDGEATTFARTLATAKGVTLEEDTPVLALLGTAGTKPAWNDRSQSAGHLAIPLASTSFVRTIPMVSRLVLEMGGDLRLLDRGTAPTKRLSMSGVFHVREAATDLDAEDRKIIPAADFVTAEGVRSVFAVGTTSSDGTVLIGLVFARELIERPYAARFLGLLDVLKVHAATSLERGRIFGSV